MNDGDAPRPFLERGWVIAAIALALLAGSFVLVHVLKRMGIEGTAAFSGLIFGLVAAMGAALPFIPRDCVEDRRPPVLYAGAHAGGALRDISPADASRAGMSAVEAFLSRARSLAVEEWDHVLRPRRSLAAALIEDAALRSAHRHAASLLAEPRHCAAGEALAAAVRDAFADDAVLAGAGFYGSSFACAAAAALLLRGELSPRRFRALYGRFEEVIPSDSLPLSALDRVHLAPAPPE